MADGRLSPDVPGVLAANEGAGRPRRRRRGLPQDEVWDGLCRADRHRGSKPGFSSATSTHRPLNPCTLVTLPISGGGGRQSNAFPDQKDQDKKACDSNRTRLSPEEPRDSSILGPRGSLTFVLRSSPWGKKTLFGS